LHYDYIGISELR